MSKGDHIFLFEYDNQVAIKLDEYDFSKLLNEYIEDGITDLRDVVNCLSCEIGKPVESAFKELSEAEIIEYLSDRYDVAFVERSWHEMFKT